MTLTHLEVSAYWIKNLAWLHGTPNLQCLSLRQLCYLQPIQYRNFLAVPQLRALDLFEMARSEEPTGFELGVVLAALQNLKVLNVECTEVGDNLVETITFGRRLAAWSRETGQALSAEQASWPQTNICQLRLSRTNITPATLGFLTSLQELQLLDIRKTGIGYSALLPLQKQFGLSFLVGGMLTASNSLALAANQNRVACACNTQGSNTLARTPSQDSGRRINLLYVMEYDCQFDWEPVQLEKGLTDEIPKAWWVPAAADAARTHGSKRREISMREVLELQLAADAATVWLPKYLLVVFQLAMVPGGPRLDDLFVTTVKTFWQVAEATAAAGSFIHKEDVEEEGFQVQSLLDYVVAIPTMNAIHGQDSWRAQHVSEEYGDHSAWDVRTIVEILGKFFDISQGTSLPELAEYNWRLDKEIMHNVFQDHYHKNLQSRFSHIPSIPVTIPVAMSTQMKLCYSSRYLQRQLVVTGEDIRATAAALLEAVRQLELDSDAQTVQQTNQESSGKPLRKFFIKRNYSACAKNVLTFTLRSPSSWQHSRPSMPSVHSAQQRSNATTNNGGLTKNSHVDHLDDAPDAAEDVDDALHDAQQLFKAAERIIKESCTEKWLLQPFIPDMERNEYRVYMVGGAEATGGPNDTAVVYTPAFHEYDDKGQRRVYVWNVTLPQHFFSRAPVDPDQLVRPWLHSRAELANVDFNSSHEDQYHVSYFPFPIWRDASMHDLMVRVAKCAADAVAQCGRPIRMGAHVMVRVDIALTRQGTLAKPFISEAHVFNDAGLSFDVWPPKTGSFSVPTSTYEPGAADGSDSNVDGIVIETSGKLPLVVDSCSADITSDAGTSSVSPHNISMGSGNDGGGSTDMSRGYLLAVKLWQEAVTTVAAASRNAAHGQK
ncbi:MAG: hypothetical protein FRX49_12695 [Trebouxia sp. A1-2]|nr:MAG: hypothetical protein FRX49_12695 [Trebouxia sp. A1-2]